MKIATTPDTPLAPTHQPHRGDPYLSLVVTTRNDSHGGNPLFRTQVFVNGLIEQCNRFALPTELIFVEWNPPADRPRLAEVLTWPRDGGNVVVRIIEIGEELHRRIPHSDRLPLFQMIAKNVGIRRARGRWVLATNIDIVFSDALMRALVERRLQERRFYRVDRYDVDGITDAFAPIEDQLRLCEASVIRVNGRYGTRDLRTGEFYRVWLKHVALPWWAAIAAQGTEMVARRTWRRLAALAHALVLGARRMGRFPTAAARAVLARLRLLRRKLARRSRHPVSRGSVWRRVLGRLSTAFRSPTLVRLRRGIARPGKWPDGIRLAVRSLGRTCRRAGAAFLRRATRRGRAAARTMYIVATRPITAARRRASASRARITTNWQTFRDAVVWAKALPALHTNGCGDFTLMSRDAWFALRGYPELPTFSMFIDSLFVYMAYWHGLKEEFLPHPIYHLEHDHGFKPDDRSLAELNRRLERAGIPQIDDATFRGYAIEMFRQRKPLDFNDDSWGFADEELPETIVCEPARSASSSEARLATGRSR